MRANDTTQSYTGSWTLLSSLPKALVGMNSYYWPEGNKIFLCGGVDSTITAQTNCYFYNITSDSYTPAAPLPSGRWSGKLLRVKDSLYLIGSVGNSFDTADGREFRYSLNTNQWLELPRMPQPYLLESAAVVWFDSLIYTIGGSTSGFVGSVSSIYSFNPWNRAWILSLPQYSFPVPVTTADAEFSDQDSTIIVVGGFGILAYDSVFHGHVGYSDIDSTRDTVAITWDTAGVTTQFGEPLYRLAGGRWGDFMLFGPGLFQDSTNPEIWGLRLSRMYLDSLGDSVQTYWWTRFLPDVIDTTADIPSIAVKYGADTSYFYLFGGYRNQVLSKNAKVLTVLGQPDPIGIRNLHGLVPTKFSLSQNYPNPFNPTTRIEYSIAKAGPVTLEIYDVLGRRVSTLVNQVQKAGDYSIVYNASNIASGVYFYRIISGTFVQTKKMIVMK